MIGESCGAGAPCECSVSHCCGHAKHLLAECCDNNAETIGALGSDAAVHLVCLAVEIGGFIARQWHENAEVLTKVTHWLVVRHTEHVLDHDLVAQANTQCEAIARSGSHGVALLCDGVWVTRECRNYRGSQLDTRNLTTNNGQCGQRIVSEDVGSPVARETVLLCRTGLSDDILHCSVVYCSTKNANFHKP